MLFDDLMQAELILFIRDNLRPEDEDYPSALWYPDTLVYASRRYKPFEIFARARSTDYFNRVKVALGVEDKNGLLQLMEDFHSGQRRAPKWDFDTPDLHTLMNTEKIATRP